MPKSATILYCDCAYSQVIADEVKAEVLGAIKDANLEFEAVADLCELAAKRDPILRKWADADSLIVVACFPRTVKWLFHAGGADLAGTDIQFLNMRKDPVEQIVSSLSKVESAGSEACQDIPKGDGDWMPWFPVIDYDRCINCKQCLNFCLFGTYVLSADDKVEVRNPASCKTNCPACARVCPQAAIIFPKYADAPINGEEVDEKALAEEKAGVNLGDLTGGDIHQTLRDRGKAKKRFASDADEKKPLDVSRLQRQLDIPADVLASLSPAEIAKISGGKCSNSKHCSNDCDNESENKISE